MLEPAETDNNLFVKCRLASHYMRAHIFLINYAFIAFPPSRRPTAEQNNIQPDLT